MLALACVAVAAALSALIAQPATLAAVDAMMAMKIIGFTAAIVVQIVRDGAVLFAVALLGAALVPVHRMSVLGFVAAAAVLLAGAEPLLSARVDTVAAAWQSFRVVGRLSGATFALTFASYLDTLGERPRGVLRSALRFLVSAVFIAFAHALSAIAQTLPVRHGVERAVQRGLARAMGLTIVVDDTEAPEDWRDRTGASAETKSVVERLAAATALPATIAPPPLRKLLATPAFAYGTDPKITFVVRREATKNLAFDAFMPARIEIEPKVMAPESAERELDA